MSLFSKKEKKEGEAQELGNIPKILPDTLIQKLSAPKSSQSIIPKKLYTDDIKSNLKAKSAPDEHKRIPESISYEPKVQGPQSHEIEKVIMIKKDLDLAAKELKSSDLPSFFAELEKRIFARGLNRKHLVSEDIMGRLKDYHDSVSKGTPFFLHELEVEEEIAKSLASLKEIETQWLLTKRNVSLAEKMLYEKESELEGRLNAFRNLLSSAESFRMSNEVAPDDKCFFAADGTKICSLAELAKYLNIANDDFFYYHVTAGKNDFASWVRLCFGFDALASRIESAKNRTELLEVLKNM